MRVTQVWKLAFASALLLVSCSEETPEPLQTPVPDIPAPFNLTAVVSATQITLSWEADASATYDEFAIYRSDDGVSFPEIGTSTTSPYTDTTVRTGAVYSYQVAGVQDGVRGDRSPSLLAQASAFTVAVNGGTEFTNSRDVQLIFSAPGGTQLVRYAENSDLSGEVWRAYNGGASFTLSSGDGAKTVYAQFTDELGSETEVVQDMITLDTVAGIAAMTMTPTTPVAPGALLRFSVTTVDLETDGLVSIDIENFGTQVEARDDGTLGDTTPDDGIYERDFAPPVSFRGTDLRVRGIFTDAAGNQSDDFELSERLTFTDPPSAVDWLPTEDITVASMTLRWEKSDDLNFAAYEIYRGTDTGVSKDTSTLVTQIGNADQTAYEDGGLDEAQDYYYVIYVLNDLEDATGSTELMETTSDEPPTAVVLDSITSVTTDQLTLTWSQNQNTDFEEYRIYRRTSPGVTDSDTLVDTITDKFQTFYDDTGLNTGSTTYYYRVYVYDKGGNSARSNEVSSSP